MENTGINTLKRVCRENKIKWTFHALERIRKRGINAQDVMDTIINGIVVKDF